MTARDRPPDRQIDEPTTDPRRAHGAPAVDANESLTATSPFEGDHTREGLGFAAVTPPTPTRPTPAPPTRPAPTAAATAPGSKPIALSHTAPPTMIDPPRAAEPAAPAEVTRAERSEPIRVFSMKDPSGPARRPDAERAPLHVQLRSLGELSRRHDTPPVGLGRLAPPRDPRQARARRRRANLGWAGVALVLAVAIAVAIWLAAG